MVDWSIMETALLSKLGDYGLAGICIAGLFFFYRKDVRQYTDLWRTQGELMLKVVMDNTQAITANTEVTRAMHKRLDIIEAVMESNRADNAQDRRRNH